MPQSPRYLLSISAFLLLTACATSPQEAPEPPTNSGRPLLAEHAMVVSAHPLATAVGVAVLRDGGNAFDAAVAVHWALAVTSPWAGNIGGGGFIVLRRADGTSSALDYRETAPGSATRDMFLDAAGRPMADRSRHGHLAVGVPGSVAGMFALHDSLGVLPMARLIQPAIDLARKGCELTRLETRELTHARTLLLQQNTRPTAFTARPEWSEGDTLFQPELARTLERIRDHGKAGFYAGATARAIADEMARGGGLITEADLAAYHAVWRPALTGRYRGIDVITMPPPSSGGVLLLQLLRGMEGFDVKGSGWQRTATVHRMVEVERRAFADRAAHCGDPDFVRVPTEELVDSAYVLQRMADYDAVAATPSCSIKAGQPNAESEQTTHFSIVDKDGNAVSCTTTLNGWYGSGVVVGDAGFVLNNEMDDFSVSPGSRNLYGLTGGEANAIVPGKRMLSSMAPTILARDGQLLMVVGSPGGATIPTTVFQVVLNVVDHGMDMQAAVEAPRFHHQWLPDTIRIEAGAITREDSLRLRSMGHRLTVRPAIGRADAILVRPDGRLEGGADPRGEDHAGGY